MRTKKKIKAKKHKPSVKLAKVLAMEPDERVAEPEVQREPEHIPEPAPFVADEPAPPAKKPSIWARLKLTLWS
jgi:hypothetical protein